MAKMAKLLCFIQLWMVVAAVSRGPTDRIGFDGNGYAVYRPLNPLIDESNNTRIRFHVDPKQDNGLVLYIGPPRDDRVAPQDFVALELLAGLPVLVVDYGGWNTFLLETNLCRAHVPAGKPFYIELVFGKRFIVMIINDSMCRLVSGLGVSYRVDRLNRTGFLNQDDPLMLGGIGVDAQLLAKAYQWTHVPQKKRFSGCLSNFTVNGRPFDLSNATDSKDVRPDCRRPNSAVPKSAVPKPTVPKPVEPKPTEPKPATTRGKHQHYIYWMIGVCVLVGLLQMLVLVLWNLPPQQDNDRDIELPEIRVGGDGGGERGGEGAGEGGSSDTGKPDDGELAESTELPEPTEMPEPKDASIGDEELRRFVCEGDLSAIGSLPCETFDDETELPYLRELPQPLYWKQGEMYGEEVSFLELTVTA